MLKSSGRSALQDRARGPGRHTSDLVVVQGDNDRKVDKLTAAIPVAFGTCLGTFPRTAFLKNYSRTLSGPVLGVGLGVVLGSNLGSDLGAVLGTVLGAVSGTSLGAGLGAVLGTGLRSILVVDLGAERFQILFRTCFKSKVWFRIRFRSCFNLELS